MPFPCVVMAGHIFFRAGLLRGDAVGGDIVGGERMQWPFSGLDFFTYLPLQSVVAV